MHNLMGKMSSRSKRYVLPTERPEFPVLNKFPILRSAVEEAENNIKAPKELIFFSALSAAAIAVQNLNNMIKPTGQEIPLSLNILIVADSGERKSTVERVFFESIRSFESQKAAEFQQANVEWENTEKIWIAKERAFISEIAKQTRRGLDTSEVEMRLAEHVLLRVLKPLETKLLYEDVTSEALFSGLKRNGAAAGLVSSEGAAVLDGRAFRDYPKLNSIWSGDEIRVDRKTGESYVLKNARLSLAIMAQKRVLDGYLAKSGDEIRGSGFWARFLVCRPKSTQGSRDIRNTTMTWYAKSKFTRTIYEILNKSGAMRLDAEVPARTTVCFNPQAAQEWLEIYNCIEIGIGQGWFKGMEDHASKLADIIARVAAIIHCFEGGECEVPVEPLRFAFDLCFWASAQYFDVFCPKDEAEIQADELEDWLISLWKKGEKDIRKNYIRQYGPNSLRKVDRLNKALSVLIGRGLVDVYDSRGIQFVEIRNPRG
ncbi:YfjI family protein [Pseudomonas sp. W2-17]|uniref:YfjI family protein n=1 Tax=Pseudomonas sp. W2-17 TaxID=3058039 RepID=UPI0034E0885C